MAEDRRLRNSQRRERTNPRPRLTPAQRRRRKAIASAVKTIGGIIAFLGGIVGYLGGGYTLMERWFPPSIEVLDLTPLYISEPRNRGGSLGAIRGIGVVLHVKTKNRPVSITGLELEGKRCLSFEEWMAHASIQDKQIDGKHIDELGAEHNRVKPFQRVSFSGRLAERTSPLVLNAWEEQSLPFTFLDPTEESPVQGIDLKFFGSIEHALPLIRRFGITVLDVFTVMPSAQTSWTVGHLRNEILDGVMAFRLLAGATQSTVPQDAIRSLRRVEVTTWKTGNVATILAERWPPSEIKPSVNRQINCYQQPPR
jgi:hypothetical protein